MVGMKVARNQRGDGNERMINASCIEVSKHALVDDKSFNPRSPQLIAALETLVRDLKAIKAPKESFNAQMANYVFYPLSHVLNKDSVGDRVMELVLQVLAFIVQHGWNTSLKVSKARELLIVVLFFLSGPPNTQKPSKEFLERSNECRLAGCGALKSLFTAAANSSAFTLDLGLPLIAQGIEYLLECIAHGNEMHELQIAAVEALHVVLFDVIQDNDKVSVVVPGVVSTFTKLLTGKYGVCHFLVAPVALDLFGELLSRVYNDADLQTEHEQRTGAWLQASKEQVRMSLSQVVSIRSHSKMNVRKSMLKVCQRLLTQCPSSLDVCVPSLLDTVIYYMDVEELRDQAEQYLSQRVAASPEIKAVLQERVYDWIESIPRLFTAHDDTLPVLVLNSIRAGLKLLEDNNVDSQAMRESLMSTLSNAVQVKSVKDDPTSFKFDPSKVLAEKPKAMAKFDNTGVVSDLSTNTQSALIHLLKSTGGSRMGIDMLQNFLNRAEEAQKEEVRLSSFWLAVNLLKGATAQDAADDWLVTESNNEGLDDAVYGALTVAHEVIEQGVTVKTASRTDLQESVVSVALEAVAVVAQQMGKDFEYELVDNIFPIVSYLGSNNGYVRRQAQQTITQVANSCGYESVRALLVKNADYLVDGVAVKLNTLDITPQSAAILSTLISLAGPSIAPYMDDLVATMFVILDNYHGYTQLTEGIFKVFQTLVEETRKGYTNLQIESGERRSKQQLLQSYDDVIEELRYKAPEPDIEPVGPEHHNNRPFGELNQNEGDSDDEDMDEEEEPEHGADPMKTPHEEEEDEWLSPVSKPSYDVVNKIVSYTDLYLTHESASLRSNLLRVIQTAMPLLSTSEKCFLPAVNNYWPVLVSKLDDAELFVREEALKTIGLTCVHAKSFMSQRIEQIWPRLMAMMPRSNTSTVAKPKFAQEQREFKAVVACITEILPHTPIPEPMFDAVVRYMAPVLDLAEFGHLREAMETVNADAVWLECYKLTN